MKPKHHFRGVFAAASAAALALAGAVAPSAHAAPQPDNQVLAWGDSSGQQLGHYTASAFEVDPKPVCRDSGCSAALTGAIDVEGGSGHSAALVRDGDRGNIVLTWGRSDLGQLGRHGKDTHFPGPVCTVGPVSESCAPLSGVQAISSSNVATLAVLDNGSVVVWGLLNDAATNPRYLCDTTVDRICASGAKAVSAGDSFALILLNNNEVLAVGNNSYGQLGDGTQSSRSKPAKVWCDYDLTSEPCQAKAIATGYSHSLAIMTDGSTWGWGENRDKQLGPGPGSVSKPVPLSVLDNQPSAVAVAAGASHSVALLETGIAKAWGSDQRGQVGDGEAVYDNTSGTAATVCEVHGASSCVREPLTDIDKIDANGNYTVALSRGIAHVWGTGGDGSMLTGDTTAPAHSPAVVKRENGDVPRGITEFGTGRYHVLAIQGTFTTGSLFDNPTNNGVGWKFRAGHSGKCLDVDDAATIDGARLQQWNCHGDNNQRFVLERQPNGSHHIVATHSGSCLGVPAPAADNGSSVLQTGCQDGNQDEFAPPGSQDQFVFEPRGDNLYRIRLNGTEKCLDVRGSGGQDGADVILWSCHDGPNQQWTALSS